MKQKILWILLLSILINIIFILQFFDIIDLEKKKFYTNKQLELPYLSKRIFIENQNDILINFIPLRLALRDYMSKINEPLGVYFEYLPSGTSVGVNDQLEVALASLIKTPIVMGIYKQYENNELKKDSLITMKKDHIDKKSGDLWKIGEGSILTIDQAVGYTLKYSDNTATNMLISKLSSTSIGEVFDSLDIPIDTKGRVSMITPKAYSSIFRSLYLSSYLTEKSSNEILDILTNTVFNDKIVSGVENGIKVAHKVGIFNSQIKGEDKGYSDCGIIYVPNRPYILCIMTKADEQAAIKYMSYISKMVYGYVVAVNVNK